MNDNTAVPKGHNLKPGSWHRITEIHPSDPDPSMRVGDVVLCKEAAANCISPENLRVESAFSLSGKPPRELLLRRLHTQLF